MKPITLFAIIPLFSACAEPPVDPAAAPVYVSEAPLPRGWPVPGPYQQVSEKSLPAYRAAFTKGKGSSMSFWTLFMHIKRQDIPMTAPVEMQVKPAGDKMQREGMAFLYQSDKVGRTGADGRSVEVRDVPAAKVLSYTWQGRDTEANVATARAALDAALAQRKVAATGFRLLGYNGPGTPRDKATWELQAVLPAVRE